MTTPSRHVIGAALAVLSFFASVAIVLVALQVASGATLQPGSTTSYDTEFIDFGVYSVTVVLGFVLAAAALYSAGFAVLGALGVFAVEWWAMYESNERLAAAGWSDGLEVLAYALPIAALIGTMILILFAGLVGRARRRQSHAQDQYTMTLSPIST